mgnify:CR=1 FL=1
MAEKRRIVILMAEAGFGHRSAAQAIAAALQELYDAKCTVEILNPLSHDLAPAFLRNTQAGYDRIVRQRPDLYQRGYEVSDEPVPTALMDGVLAVGLFQAMQDIVRGHQPDAIVAVHPEYLAPLAAVFARIPGARYPSHHPRPRALDFGVDPEGRSTRTLPPGPGPAWPGIIDPASPVSNRIMPPWRR